MFKKNNNSFDFQRQVSTVSRVGLEISTVELPSGPKKCPLKKGVRLLEVKMQRLWLGPMLNVRL